MNRLTTFIILTLALTCFDMPVQKTDKNNDLSDHRNFVLNAFAKNQNGPKIANMLTDFSNEYLYFNSKYNDNIIDKIIELSKFKWNSNEFENLGNLKEEIISNEVQAIFNNNKREILSNNNAGLFSGMRKLARAIIFRSIQLNRFEEIDSLKISEEMLMAAALEYKISTDFDPFMDKKTAKAISDDLEEFYSEVLSKYYDFLVFQQNAFNLVDDFIKEALSKISKGVVLVDNNNREISVNKIIDLLLIAHKLNGENEINMTYLINIAETHVFNDCFSKKENLKEFSLSVFDRILKALTNSNSIPNLNAAKTLFVKFFRPDSYLAPTVEYVKFINLKYVEEGNKKQVANHFQFEKLQIVYMVDLLWTTLHQKFELMNKKEIYEILKEFRNYEKKINKVDLEHFNLFRVLILKNSDLLDRYYDVFRSFYDLGLYFMQENHANRYLKMSTFPKIFDEFLDTAYQRDGGMANQMWHGFVPDKTHFNLNCAENYVAYKFINLQSFPSELSSTEVKFAKYGDLEDKNIEELLFESETFQDVILAFKGLYLDNEGLNFGAFAGKTIKKNFWDALYKLNPTMFAQRGILNIV